MHNKPCVHVYTGTHGGSLGMSILSCDGTSTHTQACYTAVCSEVAADKFFHECSSGTLYLVWCLRTPDSHSQLPPA